MNLETAIAVMLTSFGNSALAGKHPSLPLDRCEQQELRFVFSDGDEVRGVSAWFTCLKSRGCIQLRYGKIDKDILVTESDRAKLRQHGCWFIGTAYNVHGNVEFQIWIQELVLLSKDEYYPKGRYGLIFRAIPALALPEAPTSTEQVVAEFLSAVDRAATYADCNQLSNFGDCFRRARQILTAPLPPQCPQWFPPNTPEIAIRLFAAAESAYVFGTMGSWNDVHTCGEPDYNEVTAQLVRAINHASAHAANL
jgi:hypothetical protein